jgi:hypothetical protein
MMKMIKRSLFLGAMLASTAANAHTTSLGYVPSADAGAVTFWAGSYDHGGFPSNEGIVTLIGLNGISYNSSLSFNIGPVSSRPAGLVDGVNNFFWDLSNNFPTNVDPDYLGGVSYWQGVTFTGLVAGDYQFGCGSVCGETAQWESLNSEGFVTLTLREGDVGGVVPEPATWAMMLLGFAMMGAAMRYTRRETRVGYL